MFEKVTVHRDRAGHEDKPIARHVLEPEFRPASWAEHAVRVRVAEIRQTLPHRAAGALEHQLAAQTVWRGESQDDAQIWCLARNQTTDRPLGCGFHVAL